MTTDAIEIIKEVREQLKLTTPQLSQRLGFKSAGHVWNIEKGYRRPSVKFCLRFIQFTKDHGIDGVTMDKLLGSL